MASARTLTAEEKARLLQALREDPEFREELRRLLLDEVHASIQELRNTIDHLAEVMQEGFASLREAIRQLGQQVQENSHQIAALTERMDQVETQIAALTERMDVLTEQVQENSRQIAALTERMDRVETQIAALTEQVQENSRQIAALTGEVREHRIRLGDVSGIAVEASAREEIEIWLQSRGVEIARKYLPGDLQTLLGVDSVPDGLLLVQDGSGYVFLVYEITFTIALHDVRRIAEWLAGFRKVGWPAVGLVYYRRALPEEDVSRHIVENGKEVIQTTPGMRTLREEAARYGVLLMRHGAAPWRPEGWRPPRGLKELPEALQLERDEW